MSAFRIVIFTALPPAKVRHFLWRLRIDLPEVEVCGVLYERERPPLPLKRRLKRVGKFISDPDFIRFTLHKLGKPARRISHKTITRLLHIAHATHKSPNPALSLEELVKECEESGITFRVTNDINGEESLKFVADLKPDLGIVYGTRILKPQLFTIPRLGSINIHKHKVPDYRGSGAPGLWELRDERTEQVVTVHRVTSDVDEGAVLMERSFPIEPLDTLTSIGLKADLVGIDCLIEVIRAESLGETIESQQPQAGTTYKGFQPHQIWAIEERIRKKRPSFRPQRGRPFVKLLARTAVYPALYFKNRRRARAKSYPVVVLFHHVITDRESFLGMPTDNFLRLVRFLKEHYRIASLPEAIAMLSEGKVDAPTVVLTFDDGYADNFLGLRAVAEAENIPATLFVCTQHVTDRSEFQHDVDRKERGFHALSWDEVRYLSRHNVSIGSHTRTHFDCGDVDEKKLSEEIVGSLEDLQRELGHDALFFAFPKGYPQNMSERARELALESYPYVFSAFGGVNNTPLSPDAILKRSGLPQSLLELELALQSVLDFGS